MKYCRADLSHASWAASQDDNTRFLNRWAAMYNLLRTVPDDERFDMGTWGMPNDTPCGTSACAAGHAMLHPWFRKRGIMNDDWGETHITGHRAYSDTDPDFDMQFNNFEFFGLDRFHAPFDPNFCRQATGGDKLTPILVSEVVRAWMLRTWSKDKVDAAIEKHQHVKYDVNAVHRYTPWNNPKLIETLFK
jgi:hypothetical protein